jgi:hypothetical protein
LRSFFIPWACRCRTSSPGCTTFVELAGGLAVLIGAFVPIVSVPMAVVLLTALFTIHRPYGFFSVKLVEVTSTGTKFGSVGLRDHPASTSPRWVHSRSAARVPLSVDRWRSQRP